MYIGLQGIDQKIKGECPSLHLPPQLRRRTYLAAAAAIVAIGGFAAGLRSKPPAPEKVPVAVSVPLPDEEPTLAMEAEMAEAPTAQPVAAASAQAEEPKVKWQEYSVTAGDTIGGIAEHFGLSSATLLAANNLGGSDVLSIGQALIIPPADGMVHLVQEGDSLWDIAVQYDVEVEAIVKANPEVEPSALQPDERLMIPGAKPPSRRYVASARGETRSSARKFDYWPAAGPLTDAFGWRVHPVYGSRSFHDGMDIGIASGTPLRAVGGGTIAYAGWYGGYGLVVKIDHGGGVVTQYSHMSRVTVDVGQQISGGQQVGYSGNTGVSTGPHLHFSLFLNGSPSDPLPWLP
jgi:murein DD-endopeptidase MepM/ murein hydrolase activator NlpD